MAKKAVSPEKQELIRTKDFFDCIAPSTIKFFVDYYIVGDSYRCAWAIREYPPATEHPSATSTGRSHHFRILRQEGLWRC